MSWQRSTRDPSPGLRGSDIAVAGLGALAIGAGGAATLGRAVAAWLTSGEWLWPDSFLTAGVGVLLHHPAAGLTSAQAARLPAAGTVYAGVVAAELALLALFAAAAVGWGRYRRPGDARGGLATRREARDVLGTGRLHAARTIVRPDLYPPRRGARR